MSSPDDYPEEMRRLGRITERDIDRLFDGTAPTDDGTFEDLALHLLELKAAVRVEVPEEMASAHVAAMVSAHRLVEKGEAAARPTSKAHGPDVQASGLPKQTRRIPMRKRLILLTAKIGAVFVGASMVTGGMALAGVQLPDALNAATEKVGFSLPNQNAAAGLARAHQGGNGNGTSDVEVSNHGTSVKDFINAWVGDRGCEFGWAVSTFASSEAAEHRQDGEHRQDDASRCSGGGDEEATGQGGKATGEARSAEARNKAAAASGGKSEAGASNGSVGQDQASAQKPASTPQGSKSTGEDYSTGSPKGGQDNGSEAVEEGQSRSDQAPRQDSQGGDGAGE